MKEITEGNKLIAEFMGFKTYPKNHYHCYPDIPRITSLVPPRHMRFHESWDWIMPVVLRIHTMEEYTEEYTAEQSVYAPILQAIPIYGIEGVWSEVIGFIKWYNQNKES